VKHPAPVRSAKKASKRRRVDQAMVTPDTPATPTLVPRYLGGDNDVAYSYRTAFPVMAVAVTEGLKHRYGYEVYRDQHRGRGLHGGDRWRDELNDAFQRAPVILAQFSGPNPHETKPERRGKSSLQIVKENPSDVVREELVNAMMPPQKLVPLLHEDFPTTRFRSGAPSTQETDSRAAPRLPPSKLQP